MKWASSQVGRKCRTGEENGWPGRCSTGPSTESPIPHTLAAGLMLFQRPIEQRRDPRQHGLLVGDGVRRLMMLEGEVAVQVGDADRDLGLVHVGGEQQAGLAREADGARRPAAHGGSEFAFVGKSEIGEGRDPVGHDGAAEAGNALHLEPGRGLVAADQIEDGGEALLLGIDALVVLAHVLASSPRNPPSPSA